MVEEELKFWILKFLKERNDYLSYYQLDRKLSNNNLHRFLSSLSECLDILEKENYISKKVDTTSGVKLYKINEQGIKYLNLQK